MHLRLNARNRFKNGEAVLLDALAQAAALNNVANYTHRTPMVMLMGVMVMLVAMLVM
jgi:hypothetical protein